MIDVSEKKGKILSFLESRGPSLPVRIAKEIDMSPVFASAILSELLQSKKILLSSMKIGSSPLYLLAGQEEQLVNFVDSLKGMEKEAFMLLREAGELEDTSQEPAIRIALRSLKDFARPVNGPEGIMWHYAFKPKEQVKVSKAEPEATPAPVKKVVQESKSEAKTKTASQTPEPIFETKNTSGSDFEKQVLSFVAAKKFEFVEKIQSDKKELVAKVRLQTGVGPLSFLLIAKNKRTTTRDEVQSAMQRAEYERMPCLYILLKEPPKNIKTFAEEYQNLFKILVLE